MKHVQPCFLKSEYYFTDSIYHNLLIPSFIDEHLDYSYWLLPVTVQDIKEY